MELVKNKQNLKKQAESTTEKKEKAVKNLKFGNAKKFVRERRNWEEEFQKDSLNKEWIQMKARTVFVKNWHDHMEYQAMSIVFIVAWLNKSKFPIVCAMNII